MLEELYKTYPPEKWEWYVSYSGGKDSTALLLALLEYSEKKDFRFKVLHEETSVEIPAAKEVLEKALDRVREIGIEVIVLKACKNFFTYMLEKGYPFPKWNFRWCCRVYKYGPALKYLKERKALNLLAIRGDEIRRIRKKRRRNHGVVTAFPLSNLTLKDVWEYLKKHQEWYKDLRELYVDGVRGLGCWTCTVVRADPSLKTLDRELYDMKIHLVKLRCTSLQLFVKKLHEYSEKRPDAFDGFEEPEMILPPRCKGKYCLKCSLKSWRLRGVCGVRNIL